jgi:hypothetical protein
MSKKKQTEKELIEKALKMRETEEFIDLDIAEKIWRDEITDKEGWELQKKRDMKSSFQ